MEPPAGAPSCSRLRIIQRVAPTDPDHHNRTAYRWAVVTAACGAIVLVWLSLGVGIIGKDGDRANAMYFGVLAVGVVGAVLAKLKPTGMARVLLAMAVAQALVATIALVAGLGRPYDSPLKVVLLNGFFVAVFIGSAWLFKRARRGTSAAAQHGA